MFDFLKTQKLPPNAVITNVRPTDFVAGAETGIVLKTLSPAGDYSQYLPDEESQYKEGFDTFGCVSFSAVNCIEIVLNYHIANNTGAISAENIQWLRNNGYFDRYTGKLNFSDRYVAKVSGTTNLGNSVGAVGDAIRTFGLVPETAWPWTQSNWASYYAEIPAGVIALGKEFAKRFDVNYQWVNPYGIDRKDLLTEYLKYGPIQMVALVCAPWNSNEANPPIQGCGCGTQHATLTYGLTQSVAIKDFDHYRSFKKLLAWNYCIPYAAQYYVKDKVSPVTPSKPTAPTVNLAVGAPDSAPVRQLQSCLQYLGLMKPGVFGPYGPQTKAALFTFQKAHGIVNDGSNYGPQTRAALTASLN